jgi:hypothetical protein
VDFHIGGFAGGSSMNLTTGIVKSRYTISRQLSKQCGTTEVGDVDRWHTISGFHSEKSRNIDIRIRDPEKSEIPTEVMGR